jgi:hypothetical protein
LEAQHEPVDSARGQDGIGQWWEMCAKEIINYFNSSVRIEHKPGKQDLNFITHACMTSYNVSTSSEILSLPLPVCVVGKHTDG